MTHSPGPWTVHGDNHTLIGCDDQKMMLAEVLWQHVCTEWGRSLETAQANTRLMAAAPELLQALKAMIPANEAARRAMLKIGMTDRMIDNARAAVAKAQGEQR